jgi:hypothetical protein
MGQGSKNLFPNFGILQGDAVEGSDSNAHLGSDPLPTDSLGPHSNHFHI